jgi:hypothetical protein
MSYLVDTNILLRSSDPSHPMFNTATNATDIILSRGEELYISSYLTPHTSYLTPNTSHLNLTVK